MRILVGCNAIWSHTGYAVAGRHLIEELTRRGHACANVATALGLQGARLNVGGITVYPMIGMDAAATQWMVHHVRDWGAHAVISIQDIWTLPEGYHKCVGEAAWLPWFPVDHEPAPQCVVTRAKAATVPVAYSQWGAERLGEAGVEARQIPLGVNTQVFRPGNQQEARAALGWPAGGFVAVTVAANIESIMPSRKSWCEMGQAFAQFARREREAYWYVHTEWTDASGGVDIPTMARSLGIADRIIYVDRYRYAMGLPEEYLATVYQAADVLLLPSRTEGFGMPLIEAQACGTPAIATRFASMSELTVNGVLVEPLQREWTRLEGWIATPSVEGIERALEIVAGWSEQERQARSGEGVDMVREEYSWEVVGDRWDELLRTLERGT